MNDTKKNSSKVFPEFYDGITTLLDPDALGKGPLHPVGITVHYTADRNLKRVYHTLKERGLGYHLLICRDGTITQIAPFNKKVWHAGKAKWNGFSPNHSHISVSLLSWGLLSISGGRHLSWNESEVRATDAVHRLGNTSLAQYWWDKATDEQFHSLMEFCKWACKHGISGHNICGHDECALPLGRKCDPGGILPMSMQKFRETLDLSLVKELGDV